MATSSFDRDIIINETNVESLIKIVNDNSKVKVDLSNVRDIPLITSKEEIKKLFNIK